MADYDAFEANLQGTNTVDGLKAFIRDQHQDIQRLDARCQAAEEKAAAAKIELERFKSNLSFGWRVVVAIGGGVGFLTGLVTFAMSFRKGLG